MKTPTRHTCIVTLLTLLALSSTLANAAPLGTAFTYQGRLATGGNAANGSYDLRFILYDADPGGSQVGPIVTNAAVAVASGYFTVTLDFGSVFDGNARWMEIGVRTNGGGVFTTLSPRQSLTAEPYAVYAQNAGAAATATSATTANTVLGTVSASQLTGIISSNNIGAGTITSSMLANGAVGSAQLASNLTVAGTLAASRFEGNGALPWQTVSGTAQQATANTGYLLTNAAQVMVTLPDSANIGDIVRISGGGAGGWQAVGKIVGAAFGAVWTPRESSQNWKSVAASADGIKLVAVDVLPGGNGDIYTSVDSGATWTRHEGHRSWKSVASSADGTKLVTATGGDVEGYIYTSSDSGESWVKRGDVPQHWQAVASSADGTKLVAVENDWDVIGGRIYTSSDSGETWTPHETNRSWSAVASSADGAKLVAVVSDGGQIYTSGDSGVTWTPRESNRNWYSVASSADGGKLVAAVVGGQIYTSGDSGVTWTPRESNRNWQSVTSSADGVKLAAVEYGGQIYTSSDSGVTWTACETTRNWKAIASSADGAKLVAVPFGGQIYTSVQSLTGPAGASATLQCLGNGQWQALAENQIAAGAVGSSQLAWGAVGPSQLAAGAVTTDALADGAVTASKCATASNWFKLTSFRNPTPEVGDYFGYSVAAVGNERVLIGALADNTGALHAGAAYLFTTNGSLLTTFTNPSPADWDQFGLSVAVVGTDRVLIGAPENYGGYGAAYLFNTNGTLLTTFTDPTPYFDEFGWSVAAVGTDRLLIGAIGDGWPALVTGAAYLFSTNGTLLTTFTNPTPAYNDQFGWSVALVGSDRVLIGAPQDDTGATNAGAAYLFSTNGTLLTTFTNPTPAVDDYFGRSLAALGSDRVLIGAEMDDTGGLNAGAAYLFSTSGSLLNTLTKPTPPAQDRFGKSVAAVEADRVLIGAYLDSTGGFQAGAAYLFSTNGALITTFTNPTPYSAVFGCSVAAVGSESVIIGAYHDDAGVGAAHLFSLGSYTPGLVADGVRAGSITTPSLAVGAVTAENIASSQIVKSLNGLKEDVILQAGTNITLLTNGNTLQIAGTSGGSDFVAKSGDTMTGSLNLPANGLAVGTSQLAVSGGNVGIGTASPQATLDVQGNILIPNNGDIRTRTSGGTIRQLLYADSANYVELGDTASDWQGIKLFPGSGSNPAMTLLNNGRIGIGTTSPAARLHVNGAAEGIRIAGTAAGAGNYAYMTFFNSAGNETGYVGDGSGLDNDIVLSADSGSVALNTAAGRVLMATSSGNVGIGTTSPQTRLHLAAPSGATILRLGDNVSSGAGIVEMHGNGSQNNWWIAGNQNVSGLEFTPSTVGGGTTFTTPAMVVLNNGNVGIGITGPTNLLMVNKARCDGSSWINSSDRNLKQDFVAVDVRTVLDKVTSLPVQEWSYKGQPDQRHVGPVAQDFRAAFGLGADDISIATVDESGVALAAIQGLNQKVEAENKALKQEVAELKRLVNQLSANLRGGAK